MKIKAVVVVSCLLTAGVQAQGFSSTPMMYSQPEFYIGLNYAQLSLDAENDFFGESADWNTVGLNAGVQPSPYLAFEGRYGKGVGNDDHFDGLVESKLKHYFGLYVLPQFPVQDFMSVYGLLGWTKAKADFSASIISEKISETEDDFSYGVGVRFRDMRTPNGVAFFAEYAQLINRSDYDVNGLTLGLSWHF
ncbi:porin family protein [Oceanimonas baumannii]|uniref:porin family protein n=1 Tax=Oceanimonas baumannii TaxID=129578 RepID=UPI001D1836FE|nr:porin family protein [Oceanimonas baumannii]MCC4265281.1 porin family protein [Oceanimonas baumannii]